MTSGLSGSRLGKYDIISEIGQGGMSVVYRARDTQLERSVALKVMHAFLAEQPEARARFHREAVAVARLRHPHIIEIFDYSGEAAAQSYIVTELIDGFAMAELLKKGPIRPPEAALQLLRPIAEALAHAHAHGVIHRDLKPENILVGRDGSLKLTDFGIARMLDNQTLTVTGTLLGSPAYMAPEYIDGQETDARADIFSFGAMTYQFMVGRLPFEAPSPHALLRKIVSGECVPAEQANPQIHAAIARLIRRCMARDPKERLQSAAELLAAIDAVLERLSLTEPADRTRILNEREAYRVTLEGDLVTRYLTLGKTALKARRTGAALEDFDRVLSLDPHHPEVRRIVRRMARRAMSARIARDAAIVLAGTLVITGLVGTWLAQRPPPAPSPVVSGGGNLTPTPAPVPRNITFIIEGSGDLYIDGRLEKAGASDALSLELLPGHHHARVVGAKRTAEKAMDIAAEGPVAPVRLDVTVPKPPPPSGNGGTGGSTASRGATGSTSRPAQPPPPAKSRVVQFRMAGGRWVNVYVDDELVAKERQSPVSLPLDYGEHRVRFSNPCCEPKEILVRVSDSEPPVQQEPIDLKPSPARLYIDGAPQGALVEVAGKRVGLNPGEPIYVPMESTEPAAHEVLVTKGGKVLLQELATFEPGRERRLAVRDNP